jgi:hypothetical protein
MNPLVERAGQHGVGDNDVELVEARNARQQIPVGRIQPVAIRRPVADGDDCVAPRTRRRCGEQLLVYGVLVDPPANRALSLELAKRGDEESRLTNQTLGTAIVRAFEPAERQPLEVSNGLLMPLQRIEKIEHRGDEARPDPEWRLGAALDRRSTGNGQQRLPLLGCVGRGLTRLRIGYFVDPLVQSFVQLAPRDEIRKQDRAMHGDRILNRPDEMKRCGVRRHDHEPVASIERRAAGAEGNERASERPQIRRPHESGRAGRNH